MNRCAALTCTAAQPVRHETCFVMAEEDVDQDFTELQVVSRYEQVL